MNKLALAIALLATLAFPVLDATPVRAAANARSWVASTGDDNNACTRSAPCATFGQALTKTSAAGEINCVDQGEFGGGAGQIFIQQIGHDRLRRRAGARQRACRCLGFPPRCRA